MIQTSVLSTNNTGSYHIMVLTKVDGKKQIDWSKCALCEDDKDEPLQCPANSKRSDVASGYKTLAANLQQLKELDSEILPIEFEVIDDGEGIEKCFVKNQACWHKSCSLKYNNTKLARAKKRYSSTQETHSTCTSIKRTRSSLESSDIKSTCFFCDKPENKEPLHNVSTFHLDK